MKTLKEQIEIMTHLMNGGEVEYRTKPTSFTDKCNWAIKDKDLPFDFHHNIYRIKEKNKTVTIEKWLLLDTKDGDFHILETSDIDNSIKSMGMQVKVKLLDSYEVKL